MESLFELWSRRDPNWEIRYQESIMDVFVIMVKDEPLFSQLEVNTLVQVMRCLL